MTTNLTSVALRICQDNLSTLASCGKCPIRRECHAPSGPGLSALAAHVARVNAAAAALRGTTAQ